MANFRKLIMTAALGASMLVFFSAASAQEQPWFGPWETNRGDMTVEQDGEEVRGHYEKSDGRFRGAIEGEGLSGIWAQESSKKRCSYDRLGSDYWGRFRLHLSDDGKYFHGRWSYCDGESGNGEEWNGKRPKKY